MQKLVRSAGIAGLLGALSVPGSGQALDSRTIESITAHLRAFMDSTELPGLAVGIVRGGQLVYERGFGVANRETGEAVTGQTVFQIGSTSKSFTATLLARMVARGAVSLEDRLADHLPPDVRTPDKSGWEPVRLRHLASHMSGLPRQPPTLRRPHGDFPVLAFSHFEMYRSLDEAHLESEPGTSFSYSNFGFAVLGHVLERVSGKPYETLLQDELLDALGMEWTTVTLWPRFLPRLAQPYYRRSDGQFVDYMPWDTEAMSPAGGIASTVRDLAKYAVYQLEASGAVLALRTPVAQFQPDMAYGYGWFLSSVDGLGEVIDHGGEVDGYTSYFAFVPDHGVAAIMLTNTGNGPLNDMGLWLLKQAVGR